VGLHLVRGMWRRGRRFWSMF